MGNRPTQGQSRGFTLYKELGLAAVFTTALLRRPWAKPFLYLDLNAGCGWNQRAGVKGSPIIFLETADTLGANCTAILCDSDQDRAGYLRALVGHRGDRCQVHCADNRSPIDIPRSAEGLCLVDPNSYAGARDALGTLSRLPYGMDVCISWNSGSAKRAVAHSALNPQKSYKPVPSIQEVMATVGRKKWLIRQPISGDRHQWTMLVGSNLPLCDMPADGLYRTNSLLGEQILQFCSGPSSCYTSQRVVFNRDSLSRTGLLAMRRRPVDSRAGRSVQDCGSHSRWHNGDLCG